MRSGRNLEFLEPLGGWANNRVWPGNPPPYFAILPIPAWRRLCMHLHRSLGSQPALYILVATPPTHRSMLPITLFFLLVPQPNIQIQIHKYTNTNIQIHKYKHASGPVGTPPTHQSMLPNTLFFLCLFRNQIHKYKYTNTQTVGTPPTQRSAYTWSAFVFVLIAPHLFPYIYTYLISSRYLGKSSQAPPFLIQKQK